METVLFIIGLVFITCGLLFWLGPYILMAVVFALVGEKKPSKKETKSNTRFFNKNRNK